MERKAWFCPSCQKHHAPHVETCPGPVDAISTIQMLSSNPAPSPTSYPLRGDFACGCSSEDCRINGCAAARIRKASAAVYTVLGDQRTGVGSGVSQGGLG